MGSAMRKPRIQPGSRLGERRLDDGGPHDGEGDRPVGGGPDTVAGHQRPLAEGLGEGVGVGPAERLGARRAGVDEPAAHPLLAQLLRARRQDVLTGPAHLGARLLGETGEVVGLPGRRLQVLAQAAGAADLGLPVDVEGEALVVQQLLARLALVGARHVGGRDGDQVPGAGPGARGDRVGAGLRHRGGDPGGTEEVDLDRLVER